MNNFVLIIGAMKSGTTSLFDLLAAHPEIAPCSYKEPGFFAFEDQWQQGFGPYEAMFDFDPARHKYCLDGSTDYTKFPHCEGVAARLAGSAPRRFKLIYVMRHPLRRIESHARQTQRTRREVGRQVSPRPDHGLDAGVSPVSLAASSYAAQIDQFSDAHAAGDLLLLSFEELVRDQATTLRRTLEFLGLAPMDVESKHSNAAGGKRQLADLWITLSKIKPLRAMVKMLLPAKVRDGMRRKFSRQQAVTGRFRLTPEEESQLLEQLAPDLKRLRDHYGFDTSCWGLPPAGG